MFVMDSFALPVEGTETRVNAQAAAYEYMTAYIESAKKVCLTTLQVSSDIIFFKLSMYDVALNSPSLSFVQLGRVL